MAGAYEEDEWREINYRKPYWPTDIRILVSSQSLITLRRELGGLAPVAWRSEYFLESSKTKLAGIAHVQKHVHQLM